MHVNIVPCILSLSIGESTIVFSVTMSDGDFLEFLKKEGLSDIDSAKLTGMLSTCRPQLTCIHAP